MKFGHLIEYNVRNIFPKESCRRWVRGTSSKPLFVFFLKSFLWDKSKWSASYFQHILVVLDLDIQ